MLIVVWTGRGFVVLLLGALGLLAGDMLSRVLPQGTSFPCGMLVSAALTYLFSLWLGKRSRPRLVKDVKTGQLFLIRAHSSLFFISVKYWPRIFVALGVLLFVINVALQKGL